jgi:hypothetical protein
MSARVHPATPGWQLRPIADAVTDGGCPESGARSGRGRRRRERPSAGRADHEATRPACGPRRPWTPARFCVEVEARFARPPPETHHKNCSAPAADSGIATILRSGGQLTTPRARRPWPPTRGHDGAPQGRPSPPDKAPPQASPGRSTTRRRATSSISGAVPASGYGGSDGRPRRWRGAQPCHSIARPCRSRGKPRCGP